MGRGRKKDVPHGSAPSGTHGYHSEPVHSVGQGPHSLPPPELLGLGDVLSRIAPGVVMRLVSLVPEGLFTWQAVAKDWHAALRDQAAAEAFFPYENRFARPAWEIRA